MSFRSAYIILLVFIVSLPATVTHAQFSTDVRSRPDSAVSADEATEILVLGTPHLSQHSDVFEPSMVAPLIEELDAFGPDAIAVEKISGRQVAAMERWGGPWRKVVERFAGTFLYHGHRVQDETGLSWSDANARADSLLEVAGETSLDDEARLALVQSLTAAYRFPSAALQWSVLPPSVRARQTRLPDTVATALTTRLDAANEVYSIGMRLARERGHDRLYPIDHQAEKDRAVSFFPRLMNAIGDTMRSALDSNPVLRRADSLEQAGVQTGDLLPLYRYLNRDEVGQADVNIQWRTMLDVDLPDDIGRQWLALWEARNLHMAGHVRRVASRFPGERVVVIVGSSHKPFLDAYLRRMMGVRVVEAEEVLTGS